MKKPTKTYYRVGDRDGKPVVFSTTGKPYGDKPRLEGHPHRVKLDATNGAFRYSTIIEVTLLAASPEEAVAKRIRVLQHQLSTARSEMQKCNQELMDLGAGVPVVPLEP